MSPAPPDVMISPPAKVMNSANAERYDMIAGYFKRRVSGS